MSSEASSTNNQSPPSPPPPPPAEQNYLTHEFPCGTITILVKMEWAALISMEYDDQRSLKFVREGELVVKVIMPSTNPIFLTTCKVGNHRWPIAKDAPIIRFSPRTFAFGIPGLLYGLRLAPDCDEDKLDNLIKFFMDYGDYEDFSENTTGKTICLCYYYYTITLILEKIILFQATTKKRREKLKFVYITPKKFVYITNRWLENPSESKKKMFVYNISHIYRSKHHKGVTHLV